MGRVATEETAEDQGEPFEWSSSRQHMLYFFSYLMNYSALCSVILEDIDGKKDKDHKSIQLLLLTIFAGAPILFLQISIGQYTRNTCLIVGEMFPLFYGIGYSMLFISLCELTEQMFYTTKLVCYIIVILCNTFPAWMKCYKFIFKDFPNCISRKDIDLCGTHSGSNIPCFKPHSVVLSAEIFKDGFVFGRIGPKEPLSNDPILLLMTSTFFVVVFCVTNSAIVFLFLILSMSKSKKSFYTPLKASIILCLGLLGAIGIILVIQPGIYMGLNSLEQHLIHPNLLKPESWVSALAMMVKSLRLAEGGHIIFGSYIPADKPDFWRFLMLIAVYLACVIFSTIYYHLFLGLLIYKLSMNIDDLIMETEENIMFALFPTFLGILPSCFFISLVFFIAMLLLNFFSLVVKILTLEQGITKYFNLGRYSVYIRYTICCMIAITSLCMEKNTIDGQFKELQTMYMLSCVLVVAVQQIMVIVYGIQNFFDDVEYIMKIRLKALMQLMWILTPIFCFISAAKIVTDVDFRRHKALKIIFLTTIMTPIVIALVIQIFHLAKRKNLIGLLRPTERYGPPDVEERILRVLYNTRLRVRYRRIKEVCPHECLLKANAVKTALEEELKQIISFEKELTLNAKDKAWEEMITLKFRKHKKYLLRYMRKYQTNKKVNLDDTTGGSKPGEE